MKYNNVDHERDVIEYFEHSTQDRGISRWQLSKNHMCMNETGSMCTFSGSVEFKFIQGRYNNLWDDNRFIAMVVR